MKLSELKKPAAPTGPLPEARSLESPEEPQGVTSVTPSGIEIEYQWAPRRLYRLNGVEVPSVTTVLGVLDKSGPLVWWSQGIGAEGVLELHRQEAIDWGNDPVKVLIDTNRPKLPPKYEWVEATRANLSSALVDRQISVNHVKDKAADRGVNVHGALEKYVETRELPVPEEWPDHERPYINGLMNFLWEVDDHIAEINAELMVGSLEHQYAGRFDLVLTLSRPVEVVTRVYPKKPPRIEEIPAGRYLLDLKTSKRVYDTHFLQLEAYEAAAVECGYAPTDHRGVVHVTDDGRYELALNKDWCFEDFLAVRKTYQVMNEREVLHVLREELDAQETV